jgi:hypothetical protein
VGTFVDVRFIDQRLTAADRQVRQAVARLEIAEAAGTATEHARAEVTHGHPARAAAGGSTSAGGAGRGSSSLADGRFAAH